jgi:hypothetical protein
MAIREAGQIGYRRAILAPEAAIEKLRMFKSRRREVALYHHLVNQHGRMETFPTLHTGSWI